MMKVGDVYQHRCACGKFYQVKRSNQRKCSECRKVESKVEPKQKIIKEEKPSTMPVLNPKLKRN